VVFLQIVMFFKNTTAENTTAPLFYRRGNGSPWKKKHHAGFSAVVFLPKTPQNTTPSEPAWCFYIQAAAL